MCEFATTVLRMSNSLLVRPYVPPEPSFLENGQTCWRKRKSASQHLPGNTLRTASTASMKPEARKCFTYQKSRSTRLGCQSSDRRPLVITLRK